MNMLVFWDVAPCNIVEADDVSDVLTASVIRATIIDSDVGGSKNL
jgi:hypothetical protein